MKFLVVGAQKCATSWLYYCLRDHPELHLPSNKREDVYLGGDLHQKYGTDWYIEHAGKPNDEQQVGDVSVNYLFDSRSPAAVKRHAPDAKIIALLRDPIDRAISAYYWNLRMGNVSDPDVSAGLKRCLDAAMVEDPAGATYDPEEYLKNVILRGVYDVQLARYVDAFGADNLFVVPKEKIGNAGSQVLSSLYSFLGVDAAHEPNQLYQKRRPKKNSYVPALLQLERNLPDWSVFDHLINVTNQAVCYLGLNPDRPALSKEVHAALRDYYRSSVRNTFEIIRGVSSSAHLWEGVSWLDVIFGNTRREKPI